MYRRRFEATGKDSLAKLARWIRPGSRVLELGAATGYFTEHLRSQRCVVDIVEMDRAAAEEASRHAERTIVADLDGEHWDAELGEARYDIIVCADVLEHLRDGRRLLERLRNRLADGGELLLSVPNVAHSAVIASLIDERFEYGGEGLLDPTHLRLYTWRSLAGLLHETGYAVREWDATIVALFDSEFRIRSESLVPALRDTLLRRPNATVYQWLARAVRGAPGSSPTPTPVSAGESVPVRLLSGESLQALSLDRAVVAHLPVGGATTQLQWRFPPGSRSLRLLLADRIGVVRLEDFRLHAGETLLWSSAGRPDPFEMPLDTVALDHQTLALLEPDAWIEPVVPLDILMRADRATATLQWPGGMAEAGEFGVVTALARAMMERGRAAVSARQELNAAVEFLGRQRDDEKEAHQATRAVLEEMLVRRNADIAQLEKAIVAYEAEQARLHREIAARDAVVATRDAAIATRDAKLAARDAALAAQDRIIAYRQSLRWWLELPALRVKLWWHRMRGR